VDAIAPIDFQGRSSNRIFEVDGKGMLKHPLNLIVECMSVVASL
jgi:hypothetical protein